VLQLEADLVAQQQLSEDFSRSETEYYYRPAAAAADVAPHIRNVEIYDLVYRRNVADKAAEETRRYRFKEET
jgi:lipopolysaccharide biosynthesis glycosyltransferase